MKKLALILTLIIIVVILVLVISFPRLRLAYLEKSLYSETDTKAKAAIAWKILESNSEQGIATLQKYADQDGLSAFDATHNMLLLCDYNGSIHVAYDTPSSVMKASPEDKPRDENFPEITFKVTSMSFAFGDPPRIFEGIHLLDTEEKRANFILKQEDNKGWLRLSLQFEQGEFISSSHDVTDTELEQWRKNENWPEAWKHDSEKSDKIKSADDAD